MQESQSAAGSTKPAGTAESTLPVDTAESIPHAETAESTTPAQTAESTPPAEAAESTPPNEAAELTLPAEATESIPHTEAAELTPSLTAVTDPAVVDVEIANGGTAAHTSDTLLTLDPLASTPRDVTPHPLPQQSLGTVPQNQVPSPVLFQNAGRQSAQVNISNGVCNGHGTAIENGTTVGVRSEASYSALWQMLPLTSPMVFPHGLHADPLRNELTRIKQQEDILARRHEAKVCVAFLILLLL